MLIRVEIQKVVTLDARVVEAKTTEQAEKMAMKTFHKFDLNDMEMVEFYCDCCGDLIINNSCPNGCEDEEKNYADGF